ncbi:MAG: riboflavin synthase [Eubacterium sp.]|nr:riboflavin synthase [Eubacterium sp.]
MFTGIIEEVGTIKKIVKGKKSEVLEIKASEIMDDVKLGDSVAVNGVCLTVTEVLKDGFKADVMAETMRKSSLDSVKAGSHVNLERAMKADSRFGGHMVSGHIDGTGTIKKLEREDNAVWYTISAESDIMKFIVKKGSIAIDGISLTVANVSKDSFKVSIIPHTLKATILGEKKAGDKVNLENDMIGKYVYNFVNNNRDTFENILLENGFM